MAYSVSQDFKDKIKDQTAAKSCLILFDDLFFSTADFTDNGVVFSQYFNTSEDLTFGDCPSDTLSFSVVANGALSGYGFGKCRAFLGVQTGSSPYAFGDINAHIEVGNNTYTASDSGLYRNDTKIDNGVYVSLISDGTTVWAVGLSSSVSVENSTGTVSAYTPTRFMARKLRSGLSAVFASNTARVWDGTNMLTYEYVPMGEYNVNKPRSTVGDMVTVQDAYDNMTLFDKDASQFLASLTYPKTLGQIYTALCNFVGVSYASSTFDYSTTSYSSSPFSDTSCTLRDILWWIAERARKVAHFNRDGQLALMSIVTTVQETLTASDIGQDGYSVAEYRTPNVTGVLLKGTNGSSLTFGSLNTAYVISANPFISTISNTDLNAYWAIPAYVPMEINVLEADPSIDVGDFVNVRPMVEQIAVLTDVYNRIYVDSNTKAYAIESPTYSIPLMERELRFVGGIRAKYVATGNEEREADISDTEYNANVAFNQSRDYADSQTDALDESFNQQKVFNRLTNNGQAQGIFLDSNGNLYINGTYIQAHTVAVDRLTGTVSNGGWGIDFTNGTMSIGTLAVGSITGNIANGNWEIDFDNGTLTIGDISANNITAGTISGAVTATNLSMTGGSINISTSESLVDQIKLAYDVTMSSSMRIYGYSALGNTQISFSKNTVAGGVTTSFTGTLSGSSLDFTYGGSTESFSILYASPGGWGLSFRDSQGRFMTIRPSIVSTW